MRTVVTVTRWQDLIVWNEGERAGTLGDFVSDCPANLDNAVIADGKISEWQDYFIAGEGEDADWDTPRGEVDWSGFAEALEAARM